MRVLMVTRSLPFHQIGGMEAAGWDLARAMVGAGADVHIVTTPCAALPAYGVQQGVRITTLPGASARYSRAWARSMRELWVKELDARTDIVFSVSTGAFPLLPLRGETPFIMQAHGTAWGELLSKVAQRSPLAWLKAARNVQGFVRDRAYRQVDVVVAVGHAVEQELRGLPTRVLVGNTRVRLIPNGIDPDAFSYTTEGRTEIRSRYGIAPDTPVVVSTCRLHAQKGIAESLSAIARVQRIRPDLRYLIVGEGPSEASLRQQTARLGLEKVVVFVGKSSREALRSFLSAADLFLFTSLRSEVGLTLSILEALAVGLPCVVSNGLVNGMPNLAGVAPRDPAAVAAGVISALDGRRLSRTSLLPDQLTLAAAARRYINLFEELYERGGRANTLAG